MSTTVDNELNDANRAPALVMASCIFVILSTATVTAKLWKKIRVMKNAGGDDWTICVSLILSIIQTLEICLAARFGLGKHRLNVSRGSFIVSSKLFYASKLTSIVVFTCAKASVLLYVIALKPLSGVLKASQITLVVTVLWAIGIFFAQAFPCNIAALNRFEPQCFRSGNLDIVITTWNMSTDVVLAIIPYFMMRRVRVSQGKRWAVVLLFGTRLIVPPIAVIQLLSSRSSLSGTQYLDTTWSNAIPSIWEQVCLSLSIITACVYCVKHYLKEVSGLMSVHAAVSSDNSSVERPENMLEGRSNSVSSRNLAPREHGTGLDLTPSQTFSQATTIKESTLQKLRNSLSLAPKEITIAKIDSTFR